jgi:hypothetical protein
MSSSAVFIIPSPGKPYKLHMIDLRYSSRLRRMDILNADLALQNEFDKWKKSKTNQKRKILKGGSAKKRKKPKDEEEPGYHFIAYVPINDVVWRLDGLQRQPINIGELIAITRIWSRLLILPRCMRRGLDCNSSGQHISTHRAVRRRRH